MTKKERDEMFKEPWKGVMAKEDYDKFTKKMPAALKKDFDIGLVSRDANTLMDLGARGLYEPKNKKSGGKVKKNFSLG